MRWTICWCVVISALSAAAEPSPGAADPWFPVYENGRWAADTETWLGPGTHSRHTPQGLWVADASTQAGSGRFYMLNWRADTRKVAAIEARVKVAVCSQAWGVSLMAADGIHEESLTLYPQ